MSGIDCFKLTQARWVAGAKHPRLRWIYLSQSVSLSLSLFLSPSLSSRLSSMRYFDRAALFVEACLKYGVMEANDTTNILSSQA